MALLVLPGSKRRRTYRTNHRGVELPEQAPNRQTARVTVVEE